MTKLQLTGVRFAITPDEEHLPVIYPNLVPSVSEEVLASVTVLQYEYRHDGCIVFSAGEVDDIEKAKATAQMPLF